MSDETPTVAERGDRMRRQVLGDAHAERFRAHTTEFTRPLQDLVTEYCWGAVWTRPGLEPKTRSLLNLAMLTALGDMDEFAVHVKGAVTNGVTALEIREVLLQASIYCGVPAGVKATRTAQTVLDTLERDGLLPR